MSCRLIWRRPGWAAGLGLAAALAACGDESSGGGRPGGRWAARGYGVDCAQYTTCGSCTPVVGCGWCFDTSGGRCASDPDECAFSSNEEFTWTWDQAGCPDVDASVSLSPPRTDAADATAAETSTEAADGGPNYPVDAGVASSSVGDATASTDAAEAR